MYMDGKQLRMDRILKDGKAVIIALDHGVSLGPIEGIENMDDAVRNVDKHATAVLLHKGMIKSLKRTPTCPLMLHVSASTSLAPDTTTKVTVAAVADALRLGCDALSVHVNVGGSAAEPQMLKDLADLSSACDEAGLPLLAMMYPRGDNVKDSLDADTIAHVARVGAELGADIVKCPYSGDVESFKRVVQGCPVPIVIAGGPKCKSDRDVLEMVKGAMEAGAAGISFGRNVFQHESPAAMIRALRAIIRKGISIEEAERLMKENEITIHQER